MRFTVIVERGEESGYVVHCPELKGCWSQGSIIPEALERIELKGFTELTNPNSVDHGRSQWIAKSTTKPLDLTIQREQIVMY